MAGKKESRAIAALLRVVSGVVILKVQMTAAAALINCGILDAGESRTISLLIVIIVGMAAGTAAACRRRDLLLFTGIAPCAGLCVLMTALFALLYQRSESGWNGGTMLCILISGEAASLIGAQRRGRKNRRSYTVQGRHK